MSGYRVDENSLKKIIKSCCNTKIKNKYKEN